MNKASYLALAAAFGLFAGGAVAPANAADLGGGCCADLEARVAELEATTARKGNRVVSLQIYGQVNKALLYFDNGEDSDVFVVDNDFSTSRFGFKGTASIKPGWTAGYNMEVDLFGDSNSNNVSVGDDEGGGDELRIRKNELWVESERFGRVTLGQGSSAADGITEIVLGNSMIDAGVSYGGGITVGGGALEDFADNLDGARTDRIRYDLPSIYGFILSASWGEDDYYDVALRFKKEFNSVRIAAGVAYSKTEEDEPSSDNNGNFETISGSISVMHIPSGIYGAFSAGTKEFDDVDGAPESEFFYAQLGIEKRFLPYGATTVYGEYGQYDDFAQNVAGQSIGSEATRYGFGITQSIDNAAMDVYAQAQFWEFESVVDDDAELTLVIVGTRIKF